MLPVWLAPEVWVWLQLLLPEGLEASRSGLLVLVFWLPSAGGVSGSHTPVGVATPGEPLTPGRCPAWGTALGWAPSGACQEASRCGFQNLSLATNLSHTPPQQLGHLCILVCPPVQKGGSLACMGVVSRCLEEPHTC